MTAEPIRESVNWGAVRDEIAASLEQGLESILSSSAADVALYAEQIAGMAVAAAEAGDELSQASLVRQIRMLRATQRLRARGIAWGTLEALVARIARTAVRVVITVATPIP